MSLVTRATNLGGFVQAFPPVAYGVFALLALSDEALALSRRLIQYLRSRLVRWHDVACWISHWSEPRFVLSSLCRYQKRPSRTRYGQSSFRCAPLLPGNVWLHYAKLP